MERLYRYSLAEAKRNDEVEAWRNSQRENIRCKEFLDKQISEKFDGYRLSSECAELILFSFQTIDFVNSLNPTHSVGCGKAAEKPFNTNIVKTYGFDSRTAASPYRLCLYGDKILVLL